MAQWIWRRRVGIALVVIATPVIATPVTGMVGLSSISGRAAEPHKVQLSPELLAEPALTVPLALTAPLALTGTPAPRTSDGGSHCLLPPVPGPIAENFRAPACPYCAGRRTLNFLAPIGQAIRAPVSGRVSFAGLVAGIGYVTIVPTQDFSYAVTVGGLAGHESVRGQNVHKGDIIGHFEGNGSVLLSLRRLHQSAQSTYLDPAPYLAYLRVRARLLPAEGLATRPVQAVFGCRSRL